MKHFLLASMFLTLVFSSWSQSKDSSDVIDGVYISSNYYSYDTTINFYSNVELSWIDSTGGRSDYKLLKGNKTYCEISIRKTCNCHDGSTHQIILIEFDNLNSSQVVKLTPSNTTWLTRNVMIYNPFCTNFSGTLNFESHTLTLNPTLDLERNIVVDGMTIQNCLLMKPETY